MISTVSSLNEILSNALCGWESPPIYHTIKNVIHWEAKIPFVTYVHSLAEISRHSMGFCTNSPFNLHIHTQNGTSRQSKEQYSSITSNGTATRGSRKLSM